MQFRKESLVEMEMKMNPLWETNLTF